MDGIHLDMVQYKGKVLVDKEDCEVEILVHSLTVGVVELQLKVAAAEHLAEYEGAVESSRKVEVEGNQSF